MSLIHHNPRFTFVGCNGVSGVADLQIYCRDDDRLVAVVSDLIHEDGTYAVNGAHIVAGVAPIATKITNDVGMMFDYLITHYPAHEGLSHGYDETFDLIPLQWDHAAQAFIALPTPQTWHW